MLDEDTVTIALNKPMGVVSTMEDQKDAAWRTTFDYPQRLFRWTPGHRHGWADLLTNDGELAHRLASVLGNPKTYVATVPGEVRAT